MCGIFAYIGKKSAPPILLSGLKSLEYRGYDSWGIVVAKDGKALVDKRIGKIRDAKLFKVQSSSGIGHTRWATHGGITEANSHPHLDCTNKIAVVHNGIVDNFEELKATLVKSGHKFKSTTDTEVISHLVEEYKKNGASSKDAVLKTFKKIKGLNAIVVFIASENAIYAIKNSSPLVFGYDEKPAHNASRDSSSVAGGEFFLASDQSALIPYIKKVYFLEDNELLEINSKSFKFYSLKNMSKTSLFSSKKVKFTKIESGNSDYTLGKYPHFMIKEIYEQPTVLKNLFSQEENIKKASSLIKRAFGTYLIGCGSAFYAALSGSYLFSKIAKVHINVAVASEFQYTKDFLTDKSLIIALSQSGETIDVISAVKAAREKKSKVMVITNTLGSTLYRMSDYKMLLNAGPEKCVLATKSFTSKIAILILASFALNKRYEEGKREIEKAIFEITKLLQNKSKIRVLAEKLKDSKHIYILGRGLSYPTALESALKIKEVSYIHAEGFAAGELKHGVIALVEKGTPVIIYNPEDETYADTLAAAHEVKARGAYLIGVSSKNSPVFDEFIEVENCGAATIIPNVVVAQLLGYYLALALGFDPDKPRNLAKSVTVK